MSILRSFMLWLFFPFYIYAGDATEASDALEIEPSAVVNGAVNVITGRYQTFDIDFSLNGAEGFALQRVYTSAYHKKEGPLGKGWSRNYFAQMKHWTNHDMEWPHFGLLQEDFGTTYLFRSKNHRDFLLHPSSYSKCVTNCSNGVISAHTNVTNSTLSRLKSANSYTFNSSAGSKIKLTKYKDDKHWLIAEENLTNGNLRTYSYDQKLRTDCIATFNRRGNPLGSLKFTYAENAGGKSVGYVASDSKQLVRYRFEELKGKKSEKGSYLTEVLREQAPPVKYTYEDYRDEALYVKLRRKTLPHDRFEEIEYYQKGRHQVGSKNIHIDSADDPRAERVKFLKAPVGTDNTPIITQTYVYHPSTETHIGQADVYNALGHRTGYIWNQDERLTALEKYSGTEPYALYSKECLFWGNPKSMQCTFLNARTLEDKSGVIQFVRAFEYDDRGNVLKDILWGNLSGKNRVPCAAPVNARAIYNDTESIAKQYTYSNDGLNLVTSYSTEDKCEYFTFCPGTNLLTRKLYTQKGAIFKREFYEYDANGMVTKELLDDGHTEEIGDISGITERRIKYITRKQHAPIGLPEVIDETYLAPEGTRDILLKKTILKYDPDGRVIGKDVHDASGAKLYTMHWEYDARGNVIKEIDALGHATIRQYDENNNKIYEQGPNHKYYTNFTYDYVNRLVSVSEVHRDGITLTQAFKYDYLGQKIASIDAYGNETQYAYDDFGRVIQTRSPLVMDATGQYHSIIESKEYDVFGYPTKVIDGNGNATVQANTIKGQPYVIVHADGSKEKFEYYLNGALKKHVEPNSNYTLFKYDGQQRPLYERYFSRSGEKLWEKRCKYDGLHLISETDAAGSTKYYTYDGAGRVIETKKGKSRTTYEYDAAGHIYKTIEWDGLGGGVAKVQLYDLMDRVVEERSEDILTGEWIAKISYQYDAEGQKIRTITETDQGLAIERIYYDSRHLPYKIVDAAGKVTRLAYRYDYRNTMGQLVPYSEATDPEGNLTITIKDALGRLHSVQTKNSMGELLQQQTLFYDDNGNKLLQQLLHLQKEAKDTSICTEWAYDSMNRLVAQHESVGSSREKSILIKYNAYGQKQVVTKPDGVTLKHAYDSWGRLSSFRASDRSFAYYYEYDANGNVLSIRNDIDHTATTMQYDSNDRLIEEFLANGLQVEYRYDGLGLPLEITLPDKSSLKHIYRGNQLVEVQRRDANKNLCYKHTYDSFDLRGKVMSMTLPSKGGKVFYSYDNIGRTTDIQYGNRKEKLCYTSAGNVLSQTVEDDLGVNNSQYIYDGLNRLVGEISNFKEHTYAYDSLSNRISKDGQEYTLSSLNELLSDGKDEYIYDANGNPIEIRRGNESTLFKYDALDRLTSVICGQKIIEYTYDAKHRRLSKTTFQQDAQGNKHACLLAARFLYLGQNEVGSYDAALQCLDFRVLAHGKGAEIGAAIAMEIGDNVYVPMHDHAGNVAALVDANSGQTVETYRYTAFGECSIYDSQGNAIERAISPWLFSSKRCDSETGMIFFGRRYYLPKTGRWLTTDPISFAGGINLYAYAAHNPLKQNDLYGLYPYPMERVGAFLSRTCDVIGKAASIPGRIMEFVGYHIVPIPIVRDIVQIWGKAISGQNIADHQWSTNNHSSWGQLDRPEAPNLLAIQSNGMCNSYEDIKARATEFSDELGGVNVHFFHNSTHGFVSDLVESICQKVGISTRAGRVYAEGVSKLVGDKLNENLNSCICIGTHSQGGIMTDNLQHLLCPSLLSYIDVYTFGSATLIQDRHFRSATNYVSTRDIVPMSNPIKYAKALINPENVIFLPSNSFPLIDHMWDGATYKEAFQKVARKIQEVINGGT